MFLELRQKGGAVGCVVYSVLLVTVYPQVTCCNLCLSTAGIIFPELALAPSQTRFQEMVRGGQTLECFYGGRGRSCDCECRKVGVELM